MSMRPGQSRPVPEETDRVARASFPKGTTYTGMRDELGAIFEDEDFAHLFSTRGNPALAPWRLALVTWVKPQQLTAAEVLDRTKTATENSFWAMFPVLREKMILAIIGARAAAV